LPIPFGNEREEVLTLQPVWLKAEQRAVGRAGIDDPKLTVQYDDPICQSADPGVEDIKPEALRVTGWPGGVWDAARGSTAFTR